MKSWKTTLAGVAMILTGLGAAANAIATGSFSGETITAIFAAISGGIGLIAARDNNVTSEDVGAK